MPTLSHVLEVAALILSAYVCGCALGYGVRVLAHRFETRPRFVATPAAAPAPPARQPTPAQRLARTVRAETEAPVEAPPPPPPVPESKPKEDRPHGLPAARGLPDDLRRIRGVGPKTAEQLEALGIYHYWQIAAWTPPNIAWLEDQRVAIKGRIAREQWVEQAALLATAPASSAA